MFNLIKIEKKRKKRKEKSRELNVQIVARMIAGELEDSGGGLTGLNSKPASFVLVGVHGHRCLIKLKLIRIVNTWTGFYDLYMTHVGL